MKNENYITIQGWMVNVLNLSGNDLIAFALIYGFSQDGETEYKGSLKYTCKALNCSHPTVIKSIKKLVEMGLIVKRVEDISGVTFNRYKADLQVVKELIRGTKETLAGAVKELYEGTKEPLDNNTNYNTIDTNKGEEAKKILPATLFDEKDNNTFRDSRVFNRTVFDSKFSIENEAGIDIGFYYGAVLDWSDKLPTRTKTQQDKALKTDNGWLAQVRTFMRMDKEKRKLKMIGGGHVSEVDDMSDYFSRMEHR
jgi:predicted transcriptional regulator